MRFDGNRAWTEATALIRANREVLLVMAGVFIFLPAVAMAFVLGPQQSEIMAGFMQAMKSGGGLQNPAFKAQMEAVNAANWQLMPYYVLLFLGQTIGNLAMMALLTDHRRPTVGEALVIGVKTLPTLIGTVILLFIGYLAGIMVLGLAVGLIVAAFAALGSTAVSGVIFAFLAGALIAAILFILTRLSLIVPVIVIDGVRNPVKVIGGSWKIIAGNTRRLFAFYALLAIAYLVIAMVVMMALTSIVAVSTGHGTGFALGSGIISGAMGAAVGVVMVAVIVAVHRQLAGPSHEALGSIFE